MKKTLLPLFLMIISASCIYSVDTLASASTIRLPDVGTIKPLQTKKLSLDSFPGDVQYTTTCTIRNKNFANQDGPVIVNFDYEFTRTADDMSICSVRGQGASLNGRLVSDFYNAPLSTTQQDNAYKTNLSVTCDGGNSLSLLFTNLDTSESIEVMNCVGKPTLPSYLSI